jgi:DNA mismatch endonuclease (patch repair protein)
MPKSRTEYWGPKIQANQQRDKRKSRQLRVQGWRVITVWECELKNTYKLERRLTRLLGE